MDNDTISGGEELSIDEAAAAYAKATAPEELEPEQSDDVEDDVSDTTDDDELSAEDEDVEGEPGDEDQAEDGEEEDEPNDQGKFVSDNGKVRLEDGSIVSIAELKKGSLLNADYTRKTQEVAEQRRSIESQSERIQQTEKQLEQQREYVASLIKSVVPQAPDPSLLQTDPMKFISDKEAHEQWTAHLNYIEQEQQRTVQERQAKSSEELQAKVQKEWATALEKLPELKDPKRLERFGQDVLKFGAEYGYTPQELANAHHDHRQLLVLKKAMAWDKLQVSKAKVPQKVEGRPPVQRGGKRLNPQAQQARQASASIDRLKSTGRIDDAVAAYLASQKG